MLTFEYHLVLKRCPKLAIFKLICRLLMERSKTFVTCPKASEIDVFLDRSVAL